MGTFEFNGEKYEKASKHQKEWGTRLISQLQLNGDESILDLGCGDGALTKQLSLLVPNGCVLGIDASTGMIQTAKKHTTSNLDFVCMDIDQIDFHNKFDVIYSNAALHWVKNHERLLKNTLAALKPKGVIMWNFAGDGTCSNFFEVIRQLMSDSKYAGFFQDFQWPWYMPSKPEYDRLVNLTGFSKASVTEEKADRSFSNADEMIKWLDQPTLVPFIQRIPDDTKETFRSEAIEAMLQKTLQPDGTCFETFRRIKVCTSK